MSEAGEKVTTKVTWMEATATIRGRFELAAALDMPVSHNAVGAKAIATMWKEMASNLDKASVLLAQQQEALIAVKAQLEKRQRKSNWFDILLLVVYGLGVAMVADLLR